MPVSLDNAQQSELANSVVKLYLDDYAKAWDGLLQRPRDRAVAQPAAGGSGPVCPGVAAIAAEGPADGDRSPGHAVGAAEALGRGRRREAAAKKAAAAAAPSATRGTAALSSILGGQPGAAPVQPPGHEIDERYKQLRDLVAAAGGAPIDQVLKLLNDLQQQLAKMNAAGPVRPSHRSATIPRSRSGPRPSGSRNRWAAGWPRCPTSSTALRGGGARQQVMAAYNGSGGPAALCPLAVNGRYPFVPGSSLETPLDDFAHLFAPGGLIDGFFNTQLRPYVDTPARSGNRSRSMAWRRRSPGGLAQFQRAAVIRDLFFAPGSTTIAVRFDIMPVDLDAGASQVTLEFDGTSVTYAHGPARSTQITWPGPTT